jgi:hypothetical protein
VAVLLCTGCVDFKFNPVKDQENQKKHGLTFSSAAQFDFDSALSLEDMPRDYGEVRYQALRHQICRIWLSDRAGRSTLRMGQRLIDELLDLIDIVEHIIRVDTQPLCHTDADYVVGAVDPHPTGIGAMPAHRALAY